MSVFLCIFAWLDWRTIKTENFTVIYKPDYEYEAIQALKNLEYYREYVLKLTGGERKTRPVVIEDVGTLSNGFANPFFNNIHIFTYPAKSDWYLEGIEDWYRNVSVHEYTHLAHMTKTAGIPALFADLFGSVFQFNMYSPGWLIEGLAVYSESQISPYEGRLNDGFFDSYIGTRIYEKRTPTIIEVTNEPLSFPYGKIYLYGGEFLNFLAVNYGAERFSEFFTLYGSYPWAPISVIFPCLGLDLACKKVYGRSFPKLFKDWQKYEGERFSIWHSEGMKMTNSNWYKSSLVKNDNRLYFVKEMPIKIDCFRSRNLITIIEYDPKTNKEKNLIRLNSSVTTKLRIHRGNLYYTTAELRRAPNVFYNNYGITSVLQKRNLEGGEYRILFSDDIRTFCVPNDSTILYVKNRRHNYGSEIWQFVNGAREEIWEGEYLIDDIQAQDELIIVSAGGPFENPDLYRFDIKKKTLEPILKSPWVLGNIDFIKEDEIAFIANFGGQHCIYGLHLTSPDSIYAFTREGFANSFTFINDTLYFIGLSSSGFEIYKAKNNPQVFSPLNWKWSVPPDFENYSLKINPGNYFDIIKTLLPCSRIPVLMPLDTTFTSWAYGAFFLGGDATGENTYGTFLACDQLHRMPIIKFLLESYFFAPLYYSFLYDNKNYINLSLFYPVLLRLGSGISRLLLLNDFQIYDNYNRKEISPGLNIAYRFPLATFEFTGTIPLERKLWKSSISRSGYYTRAILTQVALGGEVRINSLCYLDQENPDTPAISIRGYKGIRSSKAIIFNLEYSHKLLSIRWGMWNPNFYFEDLFWNIFFDLGIDEAKREYYSTGFLLGLEIKTAFGFIRLAPQIGLALTKENRVAMVADLILIPRHYAWPENGRGNGICAAQYKIHQGSSPETPE
uniref:Bacterial surface antigen (D15) domain-containing protein n=1 Tax=candidate division WOR-3 bacterium TaxID=2052148 RepID=A0A7C4TAK5_UNCW3